MQSVTNLALKFPKLGTPTQAAISHYNLFDPDFVKSLTGEDLLKLDLECLYEHNQREIDQLEKSQKDSEFKSKHPGAENYPDQATRWEKAKIAAGQK
jgi:hypothetical protein